MCGGGEGGCRTVYFVCVHLSDENNSTARTSHTLWYTYIRLLVVIVWRNQAGVDFSFCFEVEVY